MPSFNQHYLKLSNEYIFSEIEQKIKILQEKNPSIQIMNLGIGDTTQPLSPSIVQALVHCSQEMGEETTFKGYGPSVGYPFLKQAILDEEYRKFQFTEEEIFISDGINSDIANLQEIFSIHNRVAVQDPTYPVYLETSIMAGRTKSKLKSGRYGGVIYLPCEEETNFQALPPDTHADLIYLCSPNNPTGVALTKQTLQAWVSYAKNHNALLIYDGAYEAFITSEDTVKSIYEIDGAKDVAIEMRSFSKSAGFTGLRCSYTIIPKNIETTDRANTYRVLDLWTRRVETKSNGVSYPIQKAAAATFSLQGKKETKQNIQEYLSRASNFKDGLQQLGWTVYGGQDSPYLWCKVPPKTSAKEFCNLLLEKAHIIAIPGTGFGVYGEGFVRFSAFAKPDSLQQALVRIKEL